MDEDYTRETQSGDENMQISNFVSKEQSRQANLKTTSFSQRQKNKGEITVSKYAEITSFHTYRHVSEQAMQFE